MLLLLLPLMAPAQKYTARRTAPVDTTHYEYVDAIVENVRANGCYKEQQVVAVPDASAAVLYQRALQALSDWTGPEGNAQTHIDYSDKETATVIYKGTCPLGYEGTFLVGWKIAADFTLKIRCKDGRAQTTLTISQVDVASANPKSFSKDTYQLTELASRLTDKIAKSRKRRAASILVKACNVAAALTAAMQLRLSAPLDDDF